MGRSKLWVIVLVGIAIILSFSIFTVHEREKAMLFQLGRIIRSDYDPGLYLKLPIVQNVRKFDARIQTLDAPPELYLTSEKKNVLVDSFAKWRISNTERFYKATGGNYARGGQRIGEFIKKGLKDEFGKRTIQDVVSGERSAIMDILTVSANEAAQEFGIDIVDVRIKRIDLPVEVSSAVFQRMQAERKRVAQDFRARGEEEAKRIRARADREREVTLAEAERDAQMLRGQGDAEAAKTYANAFNEDQEFFTLYRSLNAYRESFRDRSDILLLPPDSEFFRYFQDPAGK
jgi:membrane protease subunit HflC